MIFSQVPDAKLIWERLHVGAPLSITFTKKDKTIRTLEATRNPKILSQFESDVLDTPTPFDKNDPMFRLFDVQARAWKRIYRASISDVTENGKPLQESKPE